jgi:hypothetical protein
MPAHPALEARVTAVLGDPTSTVYQQAKGIVIAAPSLTDAVQSGGFFLGPVPHRHANEINDMLGRLPSGVADGVLKALQDAVRQDARVVFKWNQHPANGFDYSDAMNGKDATSGKVVHLELRTPET